MDSLIEIMIYLPWKMQIIIKNGGLHRDHDLLAIEYANGYKAWFINRKCHHDNGLPAAKYANGNKEWWINGELHRDHDLPAMEDANGDKIWFKNGKCHRDSNLPAVENVNGNKFWYIYDNKYTYEKVCNYYKIFLRFGRYCLKKIRIKKLRRLRWIHGELLCMPPKR
jgi:hypothetical protein